MQTGPYAMANPLEWAWTWSGLCFGYWIESDLWTYGGKHIGRRLGNAIYGPNGRYVGELMGNGRLITNKTKAGDLGPVFVPTLARDHQKRPPDDAGHERYAGYDDFPHPDAL